VILPGVRWGSVAHQRRIRFCRGARRTAVIPVPCSTLAVSDTGCRNVEGGQRLLWDHRERSGALTGVAARHAELPSDRRDPHAGGWPRRRCLVPTRPGRARGGDIRPPRPCHQAPDQQSHPEHDAQGLEACRLLEEDTIDHHRSCAQPVVLLWPLVVLVAFAAISGVRGQGARGGPMGQQPAAARLLLQAGQALCRGSETGLQALPQGFASPGLVGPRPASARQGPCLNGHGEQMVRCG
jgi:hypothetical protein